MPHSRNTFGLNILNMPFCAMAIVKGNGMHLLAKSEKQSLAYKKRAKLILSISNVHPIW